MASHCKKKAVQADSNPTAGTAPRLDWVACPGASRAGPNGPGDAQQHRMAYWDWASADPAGGSHLVLAVHGLSRNGRDFDVLAQRLSRRARVVCPDTVGRGRSDWLADPQHYQIPTYVADMLVLAGHVLQNSAARGQPITRLDWVGTSMGGVVGLAFASLPGLPLPVSRLVLNDVGPAIEWDSLQRIGQYLGQSVCFASVEEGAAYLREIAADFGPHSQEQWLALSRPMLRATGDGRWTLHYDPQIALPYHAFTREQAEAGGHTLWSLYDALKARTLLIRGAHSDLLSQATAQAMAQRGPRAEVVELAGIGHAPTLVHDDQVQLVERFLFD